MTRFEEGLKIVEECLGNGKDNVISLSTLAYEADNRLVPFVRDVDAFYEDGVFYITTWAKSKKIQQVEKNQDVAFAVHFEGISGNGIGKNLGWVMDPKNAAIRSKLREAFSEWYDVANNEKDENCVILAVEMTKGYIFRDHGALRYNLDFVNRKELD